MGLSFEQGPIRPPSEARSLLIRVTRNCPWNKCAFCFTYQGDKFGLRTVEEVKEDIRNAKEIADSIRELSWKRGGGGNVGEEVIDIVYGNPHLYSDYYRSIAAWLYFGGRSVFLQDANSLILKTGELLEVLHCIKESFPQVDRITSYCRSKTAARKTVEELKELKGAGLNRIHIGLETGYDPLLKFIRKGSTAADHIEGGQNVVASGISLCEYVMPGLGGAKWSRENALETARVINRINPDFIRFRSLQVKRGTELYEMKQRGEFHPLGDEDVLKEIRLFIEHLEGIGSSIVSDHILNLLEDLQGKLPQDRDRLLKTIDSFFALPDQDRLIYRLGRRKGFYRGLSDLANRPVYDRLKAVVEDYKEEGVEGMDRYLDRIRQNFI